MGGADLVLRGAVRTGDPHLPLARAVAVRDGLVVALDTDALELADGATEVVDAGAVLPGFGDGHVHPLWGGVELAGPAVRDLTSVEAVAAEVRRYAAEHPDEEWVLGGPYDPALAPRGLFDAAWLDAAVPDRPVVLQASDHHCAWVNTEALRRAGIDAATPDPPTGSVARRADGSPLGTLVEWTAMDLVLRHAPSPGDEEKVDAVERASALLADAGVTWAQEAALAPADVAAYLTAAREGRLHVRVNIALRAEPGEWPAQRAEFVAARRRAETSPEPGVADRVSVRTVKLFADGIVEAGTAALLAPYDDLPPTTRTPAASRSGSRRSWPPPRRPSTPTGSSCTSTRSATPGSGRLSTPSRTSRRSTARATAGRSSRTPRWSTRPTCPASPSSAWSPTSSRCGRSWTPRRPSSPCRGSAPCGATGSTRWAACWPPARCSPPAATGR